jgi:hypothetical protein
MIIEADKEVWQNIGAMKDINADLEPARKDG